MPIIRIEALGGAPANPEKLLRPTAEAAAAALGIDPLRCWVVFRTIGDGHYFEGGRTRTAAEALQVAPLVTISLREGRPDAAIRAAIRAVAEAVGKGLGLPADYVFVECHEIRAGRAHTGGEVV